MVSKIIELIIGKDNDALYSSQGSVSGEVQKVIFPTEFAEKVAEVFPVETNRGIRFLDDEPYHAFPSRFAKNVASAFPVETISAIEKHEK